MPLIQKLKFQKANVLKAVLVAACIAVPWNATAINHGSLTDQLLSKKLGRNLVESLLVKSLLEITEGQTKQAFETVNELIRTAPKPILSAAIYSQHKAARSSLLAIQPLAPTAPRAAMNCKACATKHVRALNIIYRIKKPRNNLIYW
jgi:hypothetical protein